jgi:hypothetical protein
VLVPALEVMDLVHHRVDLVWSRPPGSGPGRRVRGRASGASGFQLAVISWPGLCWNDQRLLVPRLFRLHGRSIRKTAQRLPESPSWIQARGLGLPVHLLLVTRLVVGESRCADVGVSQHLLDARSRPLLPQVGREEWRSLWGDRPSRAPRFAVFRGSGRTLAVSTVTCGRNRGSQRGRPRP